VVFYGMGSSGQQGIYALIAGSLTRVADLSTPLPGNIDHFTTFASGSQAPFAQISDTNVVFFGAGSSSQGIYAMMGGTLLKIADTSTAIPGGSGMFTGFDPSPTISAGMVAFIGSGAASQQGVYDYVSGNLTPLATTSTAVPGGT